jgi:plasmanylethanolamine desaturase
MFIISKVFLIVLLSDFVSGFFHWLEDVYAKPGMPLVHQIAVDNELHHTKPREFLKKSWWQSSWDVALVSSFIVIGAWWADILNWSIILFAVLTTNANQIHKWTHQNSKEKPAIINWLQKSYVLQTSRHHGKHHSGKKNTHYCVMTNVLNPLLEKVNFWRNLEYFNQRLFGLKTNQSH